MFQLASFDEYIVVAQNRSKNKPVGIYPELKNPEFFDGWLADNGQEYTMGDLLLSVLERYNYNNDSDPEDCLIQVRLYSKSAIM